MSVCLSSIFIYPVKGLRGIPVERAFVEKRGLQGDRRWMVVDPDGLFRSQRSLARMATIRVSFDRAGLTLMAPFSSLSVPLEPDGPELKVRVWKDEMSARGYGEDVDQWLTEALGEPSRLVKMPPETIRPIDPDYSRTGDAVSFADAFPLLLTTEGSLSDLNARLDHPVPINRFRPNLVLRGSRAWSEDTWSSLRVGQIPFRHGKRCGRCLVTTLDHETGLPTGDEPLRTLGQFRKVGNVVFFGVYVIPGAEGWIQAGDAVTVG